MRKSVGVIRIPPFHYIHILDTNTNISMIRLGPDSFVKQDHEKVTTGMTPRKMITIPPMHYVMIKNPVVRDAKGEPTKDEHGEYIVIHGENEVRTQDKFAEPFPLYPREELISGVEPLLVVKEHTALHLEALRDFKGDDKVERSAGDEWHFLGPATYIPRPEIKVVDQIQARVITKDAALKLRAKRKCKDKYGQERQSGEEWLVRERGIYMPAIDEEVVSALVAQVLTSKKALHLRATKTFKDAYGKERKAGEEWLITNDVSERHIIEIYEDFVKEVNLTVLDANEYCVIHDPVDAKGVNQLGNLKMVKGDCSFFLQPGESVPDGIQKVTLLGEDEAVLVKATEGFQDPETSEKHQPGDKWMVYGPRSFIAPVEIEILENRKAIPLDETEGIYVRDSRTGIVRSVVGKTYMLEAHEELWEMELSETIEGILKAQYLGITGKSRNKTRVVTFHCPFNSAVQVYDYKRKCPRVVFGPALVTLEPDEQFTLVDLSGGTPKKPGKIKTIAVNMGPDFSTDVIQVETTDHASLRLRLSYNWRFELDKTNEDEGHKIFQVRDFVGHLCMNLASKVRGAVANVTFDEFHKTSAKTIRKSIFGINEEGKIKDSFRFEDNNLVVFNVDIQNVEPVDDKTSDMLQQSVTLAIEITTKSQEASAQHLAEKKEQEARGALERQKIGDEAQAEAARKELLQLQAESASVMSQGLAIADAKAKAEASKITGKAEVTLAELKSQAATIMSDNDLYVMTEKQKVQFEHTKAKTELEIQKAKELADIENAKFGKVIDAIGQDTLIDIANAGPELQAKLLQGLGLSGFVMMDGNNPINLFDAANGLLGGGEAATE